MGLLRGSMMKPSPRPPRELTKVEKAGLDNPDQMVTRHTFEQIADRLSRPIPKPAQPVPRAKASWRTLKPGDHLQLKVSWFRPGLRLPEGTQLEVSKVDSLGICLTHISEESTLTEIRWRDPEWKKVFEKVRRTGRKKTDGPKKEG